MAHREGHPENRIGSLRQGLLVLLVCLAAGFAVHRLRDRSPEPEPLVFNRPAMGTLVTVTVPGTADQQARHDAAVAAGRALAEAARVDSLFSWRLPVPRGADPAALAREQREVLEVALDVIRESDGAFDPRIRPLVDLWGFDGGEPGVPDTAAVAAEVARLNELGQPADAAELESRPDVLHFGAWAKGHAVDRALDVLQQAGLEAALVNAGGEIRGFGRPWKVGIQHPRLPGAVLAVVEPGQLAVATSGDYEQYFEQEGVRYCHLLDPRSGRPADGCRSVTVLAPSCARADALATAVFVLGPRRGMDLVESLDGIECLIIDAVGERHDSSGMDAYLSDG